MLSKYTHKKLAANMPVSPCFVKHGVGQAVHLLIFAIAASCRGHYCLPCCLGGKLKDIELMALILLKIFE